MVWLMEKLVKVVKVVVVEIEDSTTVVCRVVVMVVMIELTKEIVSVIGRVIVEVVKLGRTIKEVVPEVKTTVLVAWVVVVVVLNNVTVVDVAEIVTVEVKTSGAGRTHITGRRMPQLVAAKPVIRLTSKYEQDGSAMVDVGGVAHGPPAPIKIDEIASANCPEGGTLVNVKPLAVH